MTEYVPFIKMESASNGESVLFEVVEQGFRREVLGLTKICSAQRRAPSRPHSPAISSVPQAVGLHGCPR